jgi:hypothetical protein
MREGASAAVENFSIICGGPVHRLQVHLREAGHERYRVVRRAVFVVLVTWLPLLILSFLRGDAYGSHIQIPFLRDFAANARFLIAAPILILAEPSIDKRWRMLALHFLRSGLVAGIELPSFEAVIAKITRLRDRVLPEAILIVVALAPSILLGRVPLVGGVSDWHTTTLGTGEPTPAGWWFNFISVPFFRFLLFRWVWRLLLWTSFLWRVSRLNLYLVATHADMAAGLGFLSEGQKVFGPIVFAGGAVVAAQVGNTIAYHGATLDSQKFPMIVYGVLAITLLVAPLLVVAPVLRKTRTQALAEYGSLVTVHDQQFDAKWIRQGRQQEEAILGTPDPSSLADLGSSFAVIRQMRFVPVDKPTLVALGLAAALPMVPVIVLATPLGDLIHLVLRMLG